MEMSSPANRNLDDDIDIDFDDYQGGVQLIDDEHMLEDADPTRPTTATDDIMDDDMLPGEQVHMGEEIMQDGAEEVTPAQQEEDEELIDYGDEDFLDQPFEDPAIPSVVEAPTEAVATGAEEAEGEIVREAEDVISTGLNVPTIDGSTAPQDEFHDSTAGLADEQTSLANTEEAPAVDLGQDFQREHAGGEEGRAASLPRHEEFGDSALPPISVNAAMNAPSDAPGTPTDTGLHPMTVRYNDIHIPLFKSRRQPDGLLKDDNLANLSLAELIKNCRQRLVTKGEDISEDQEVLLGFDSMGLMLVEVREFKTSPSLRQFTNLIQDSRVAFECSLNDVLEVYLQLHQNDGIEEIPPLSLTLTPQLKFLSSFSIFKQAAAGGQGMSSFGFLQPLGEELQGTYEEDAAEDHEEDYHEGTVQEQFDETGYPEHDDDNSYEDQEGEHAEAEQPAGAAEQYDHGTNYEDREQYQEEAEHEDEEHDYVPNDQDGELHHHGEVHEDDFQSADVLYTAPLDSVNTNAFAEDSTPSLISAPAVGKDTASAASSTTVQGDPADGSAGEYNEELIDWDDDTLTSYESEPATEGHEDFSTFLTEYEDHNEAHADGEDGVSNTQPKNDVVNPDSEDFLNDLGGGETREVHDQGDDTNEEHGAGEDGQDDYNQADIYDEQQEEEDYHPDYQPGEDDDQFHTAHDFLDGQAYEHGLEHDVHSEDELDDTVGTVVINRGTDENAEDKDPEDFEDDLGFEDDAEQQQAPEAKQPTTPGTTGSPLGKRSFNDFDDVDELDDTAPELKKARAS